MKQCRRDHSSCALGQSIFVFCGQVGINCEEDNSIEVLYMNNPIKAWSLVEYENQNYPSRNFPLVCPIGPKKIVIMGGWNLENRQRYDDVCIFDVKRNIMEKVINNYGIGFASYNPPVQVRPGLVIGQVETSKTIDLVSYSLLTNSISKHEINDISSV